VPATVVVLTLGTSFRMVPELDAVPEFDVVPELDAVPECEGCG
jgi:hypothetical protein